jgi:hypothetical protein
VGNQISYLPSWECMALSISISKTFKRDTMSTPSNCDKFKNVISLGLKDPRNKPTDVSTTFHLHLSRYSGEPCRITDRHIQSSTITFSPLRKLERGNPFHR